MPPSRLPIQFTRKAAEGKAGVEQLKAFFYSKNVQSLWGKTQELIDVQDEPVYQRKDIDLIWCVGSDSQITAPITVECKCDTYVNSKNLFFETRSKEEKRALGCFLLTEAEWFFYYFIHRRELFAIPTFIARPWFLSHIKEFESRSVQNEENGSQWKTWGRLVPRDRLLKEVPGISVFRQARGLDWERVLGPTVI